MHTSDDIHRENQALRERIEGLSAAVLRISESLDLDTVLRAIVDSARSLTGARYGVITTVDGAGQVEEFVTSGFTSEENTQLASWSDGARLFEYFRNIEGPIRLKDLPDFVRGLGFSSELMHSKTFQGSPMRHRGVHVGHFFLAGKQNGSEFTDDDEEVLILFAAQAATAIANATTHQAEREARADLEALVETSPVGVVVFDARTGRPKSYNRGAARIAERLRTPGKPMERLLEEVICRRADGREVALGEFPLASQLGHAETVRTEEIVLSVPDGRRVRTLINATPIPAEGGEVESVVVTLQDLAPLEHLDRLRADFLSMVSHELRAPLTSIKGSTASVLGAASELDPAELKEFFRIIDGQADHMRGLISDLLDAGRIDAGTLSVEPEPSEVSVLVERARTTFLTGGGRHAILIDLPAMLPLVMADRRRIVQVLNNLLANAARHSPESVPVRVAAVRDGIHVAISVADEGRGVEPERLPHLFRKYAADSERGTVGYGLGLAICKGLVEAHGGRIAAESAGVGQGARFTFTLPVADAAGVGDGSEEGLAPRSPRTPPAAAERKRVLVVDDDPQTLRFVRDALAKAGYAPLVTGEPREVSKLLQTEQPHLVLLDLLLPGTNGIGLMESIPELSDRPVIFISGYGRDETIARALEAGAADYIVKPFSPTELTARVRAALRRQDGPQPFVLGELAIHHARRRVTVSGRRVELTATEYELLRVLALNAGRVVAYDTLLRQVWGEPEDNDTDRVRTFVKKLRGKLGDAAASPTYIFTERGVGYRMPPPGDYISQVNSRNNT